ncbi:hypothetical protein CBS101457_005150 [Exobasidium rhododendri]|nr:hypothetical protein CBS101457_005150 [Exobasidium rhododendri]
MSFSSAARAVARSSIVEASARRTLVTSSRALAQSPLPTAEKNAPAPSDKSVPWLSPSPLSPSAPPVRRHNPLKVAIVTGLARLMGYNSMTSKAIRVTSDLYDRCAQRADLEADFWYGECQLPRTYQVWFQITNLHIYLLMTRFRALPTRKLATTYAQELTNHYFIDAESRMRVRFGIQTARLVKGNMKDMHTQQRGSILSMDEALAISAGGTSGMEREADADAILTAALWRNIWGAGGWGEGVGGVKRKLKGVDRPDEKKKGKDGTVAEEEGEEEGSAELAPDLGIDTTGMSPYAIAAAQQQAETRHEAKGTNAAELDEHLFPAHNLEFAVSMQKLVTFVRRESVRLAALSDEEIEGGFITDSAPKGITDEIEQYKKSESIANFGRI